MAIVRFDPFRELAVMQDRMNRLFGDVYGRRFDDDVMTRGDWVPAVDIYENDQHQIVIKAEMPGMKREDIELRVENNTLTIRGERKRENEVRDEQYHRVERSYGVFARSFSLPPAIDPGHVSAEYKEGVLSVTLPLREEAKPREIPVEIK